MHRLKNFSMKWQVKTMTIKEELSLINEFSRKELSEDDVYIFTLTLCDNEVDRDFEKFSLDSLRTLQELFKGKTGITDHSMRSKDQSARIFRTWLESDNSKATDNGESYTALKARAYMLKTESNTDLIKEIDGGIKKEVSVSCSAEKCICSICGKDMRKHECKHIKGKTYGKKLCYGILTNLTDAYEWSFVAVPAQRKAGVTKSFFKEEQTLQKGMDILKSMTEDTVLTVNQAAEIKEYIAELENLSSEALTYKQHLTEEIQRYALIIMPKVDTKQFTQGCSFMNLSELRSLRDGLKKQAGEIMPPMLQLRASSKETSNNNNVFKI